MYSVVKGTHDVILKEADKYTYIEYILQAEAELFGFCEFRTPIIESSELFLRSVGNSSDIVRKEMYTFLDKGDRSISLRPELTAGVIRSMVNNKLFVNQDFPIKAYYVGPCFRYERPQQGRYRQFNQFGVECVGVNSAERDAETIILGYQSLCDLGFSNIELKINNLGDEESRNNYKNALRDFFANHLDNMCSDCKERYELNVLRILDCKVPEDQEIVKQAPKINDYLSDESKEHFNKILEKLDNYGISYSIDENLVRGLDYYSGVVFEFHYTSKIGKNYGAIGAGGHYNKLVKELGGPELEGIGFALGIERLASVMTDDDLFKNVYSKLDMYVMPLIKEAYEYAESILYTLRNSGLKTEITYETKNINTMFKKAERREARFAIIIGEDELNNAQVTIRDLQSREQETINVVDLMSYIDGLYGHHEHCEGECCEGEECHCHHHEDK